MGRDLAALFGIVLVTVGCSASSADDQSSGLGATGGNGATASGGSGNGSGDGTGASSGGPQIDDDAGGGGAAGGTGDDCTPKLIAVVRDFDATHVDFERYSGSGISPGLVENALNEDGVPVLATKYGLGDQVMITSADSFAEWYSKAHPEERTYRIDLDNGILQKSTDASGNVIYESDAFFPIDGAPSQEGDRYKDREGNPRNFHFTVEILTHFRYGGGEVLGFRGDDDLWVFIDKKLAVDVGGMHSVEEASVELDTLGLELGKEYELAVFHAERHTDQSNFKITTSVRFSHCGVLVR